METLLETLLEADLVTGGYGATMVLREFSLRVPRGSIYGFLGPNGAGKTTALRMFLGLLRPLSGEIRLFGKRLPAGLPENLRRVGSLIEQPSLYDHLTGWENVDIIRRLRGLEPSATDRAIEAAGAQPFAKRRVREYSRGMRQRLGISIAVVGNPDLLLLDEPMNGLDANALQSFRELLRGVHREYGTTIVLSSHQLDEIDQVATHIGILSHTGDLLFEGTREQLSARIPQHLLIKVDRREDALATLEAAGFAVDSRQEHLRIDNATADMAREANRVLVTKGIGVHHLSIELATLERQFDQVLSTVKVWERV
jgi:ABC-2 type transport system ATP-binding protein